MIRVSGKTGFGNIVRRLLFIYYLIKIHIISIMLLI